LYKERGIRNAPDAAVVYNPPSRKEERVVNIKQKTTKKARFLSKKVDLEGVEK
jgi:hypothetical protein